jgi:hypothetical protein
MKNAPQSPIAISKGQFHLAHLNGSFQSHVTTPLSQAPSPKDQDYSPLQQWGNENINEAPWSPLNHLLESLAKGSKDFDVDLFSKYSSPICCIQDLDYPFAPLSSSDTHDLTLPSKQSSSSMSAGSSVGYEASLEGE